MAAFYSFGRKFSKIVVVPRRRANTSIEEGGAVRQPIQCDGAGSL